MFKKSKILLLPNNENSNNQTKKLEEYNKLNNCAMAQQLLNDIIWQRRRANIMIEACNFLPFWAFFNTKKCNFASFISKKPLNKETTTYDIYTGKKKINNAGKKTYHNVLQYDKSLDNLQQSLIETLQQCKKDEEQRKENNLD